MAIGNFQNTLLLTTVNWSHILLAGRNDIINTLATTFLVTTEGWRIKGPLFCNIILHQSDVSETIQRRVFNSVQWNFSSHNVCTIL